VSVCVGACVEAVSVVAVSLLVVVVVSVGGGGGGRRVRVGVGMVVVCAGWTYTVVVLRGGAAGGGCEPGAGGNVPAIVPPGMFGGADVVGRVKLPVVSLFVAVAGGLTSPGPLIVDDAPLACPSWITSYCCWLRCAVDDRPRQASAAAARSTTVMDFLILVRKVACCVPPDERQKAEGRKQKS
jgi:hypothetical protein